MPVWRFCYIFGVPGELWDTTFRLKLGVWTQHVIQVGLRASCDLVMKMSKMGSQLGPQHGGNELTFSPLKPSWLHLGAILPSKWLQDPPRSHLGAILEPSWSHFGVILGPFWHRKCAILALKWPTPSIGRMPKSTARWRLVGAAGGYCGYYCIILLYYYIIII